MITELGRCWKKDRWQVRQPRMSSSLRFTLRRSSASCLLRDLAPREDYQHALAFKGSSVRAAVSRLEQKLPPIAGGTNTVVSVSADPRHEVSAT